MQNLHLATYNMENMLIFLAKFEPAIQLVSGHRIRQISHVDS